MAVVIDKSNSKNITKILREKLKKTSSAGNLKKHFGKLKRNIDGLNYQTLMRENEDWFSCWYKFSDLYPWRKQYCWAIFGIWLWDFFYSEIELLGFKGISKSEDSKLRQLINDCFLLEWNSKIKEKTIDLKRKYNVKLPDAIIAATSLAYQIPLVTADKGFSKIKDLDLVILEM